MTCKASCSQCRPRVPLLHRCFQLRGQASLLIKIFGGSFRNSGSTKHAFVVHAGCSLDTLFSSLLITKLQDDQVQSYNVQTICTAAVPSGKLDCIPRSLTPNVLTGGCCNAVHIAAAAAAAEEISEFGVRDDEVRTSWTSKTLARL